MIRNYIYMFIISILFSSAFTHDCVELNPYDYGYCDMLLGVGWTADGCTYISGCDWTNSEGNDDSEYFFDETFSAIRAPSETHESGVFCSGRVHGGVKSILEILWRKYFLHLKIGVVQGCISSF